MPHVTVAIRPAFRWCAPERRFIPAITEAAEDGYARALTHAARQAVDLGLPLPPHVQRWIPDAQLESVRAQLRGAAPVPSLSVRL